MGAITITSLSNEVLHQIFSYFCLHCCNEFKVPNGVGTLYQDEKRRPHNRAKQQRDEKSWYSLDRQVLFSLSLSCKSLHHIAQDVLYHEFVLGYGDSYLSESYSPVRLASFMRTVTRRRDLAAKVRKLSIHPRFRDIVTKEEIRELLPGAAAALGIDLFVAWERRISEASEEERQDWSPTPMSMEDVRHLFRRTSYDNILRSFFTAEFDQLHEKWRDVREWKCIMGRLRAEFVAMLIALLPNIDYLSFRDDEPSWLRFSSFKALGIESLPKVKTIDMQQMLGCFLKLATGLETLNVCSFMPTKHDAICELPNVKALRVTDVRYGIKELKWIVSCCTGSLRSFVFEPKPGELMPLVWEEDGETSSQTAIHFTSEETVDVLKNHRETLKSFHLDFRRQATKWLHHHDASEFTLQDFTSLRTIFLSTGAIFNSHLHGSISDEGAASRTENNSETISQKMPPSLVSLHLAEDAISDMEDVQNGLVGLAKAKQRHPGLFPHLKHVGLHSGGKLSEIVDEMMTAADISFAYETWPCPYESSRKGLRCCRCCRIAQ